MQRATITSLTKQSRRQRSYTVEEEATFLDVLERIVSVAAAANAAGVTASIGYQWANKAGVDLKRAGKERRERYRTLRAGGACRAETARQVGVSYRTAQDWDQGIRHTQNRRMYPHGRVIEYDSGMTSPALRRGHIPGGARSCHRCPLPVFAGAGEDPRFESNRVFDPCCRRAAWPIPINDQPRSPPQRHQHGTYEPYTAQRCADQRRGRPKDSKMVAPSPLRDFVQDKLRVHWSPEQICHALVNEYPTDAELRVSPETIYQALYFQARGGLKKEVETALRTGRTRRKPQNTGQERRSRFVDPMVMIADRPPEIENRAVPAHWEGDLITGTLNQSAIATLVERTTRYVMLVYLPGGHTAEEVRDGLVATMKTLPAHLRG